MSGETMQGRRLPDADIDVPGPGWEAWGWQDADGYNRGGHPGDYMKVQRDGLTEWFICDPLGKPGRLSTHTITEHEDGTITVSPSILDSSPGGWHGYLEHGIWREV